MATVYNLMVEMGLGIARLETDMNKATNRINAFTKNVDSAFKTVGFSIAGYFTFSGVVSAIQSVTAEAAEQQRVIRELRVTLESQGYVVQQILPVYQEWAEAIRQTTVYSDEEAMSAMKFLTIMGIAPAKMQAATRVALDLATAMGMDLEKASQLVGQAMNGQFRALGRLIPELKNLKGAALDSANVFAIIEKRIGPQAQAEADSYGGQVKRLKNEFGELKEEIGNGLVPVLTDWATGMRLILSSIREFYNGTSQATNEMELRSIQRVIDIKNQMGREYLKGALQYAANESDPRFLKTIEQLESRKIDLERQIALQKREKSELGGNLPKTPPGGLTGKEDAGAAAVAKRWASTLSDIQLGFNNINVDPMIQELSKVDKQIKEWRTEFGGKVPGFDIAMVQYQASETSKIITKYANEDFDTVNKLAKESNQEYIKREKEKAEFAMANGAWLLVQSSKDFDALVEMAKRKSEQIIAVEKWEYDQREKKYEEFWNNLVGMANELSGDAGVGAGKVAGGLKGITDISAGVDKYSQEIEVAYNHYQDMKDLYWTDYENRKEVAEAYAQYIVTSENSTAQQRITIAANVAGMMSGSMLAMFELTGQKHKEFYTLYKAYAIAETVINTYKAAMGAYSALASIPYVGPALGAAAAAAAIAFGMARVAQISSTQPGSATTGAVSSAGGGVIISNPNETTSTTTTSTQRAQGIQIYIYGNVYDEKKLARELQPYLTQAQGDGVQ